MKVKVKAYTTINNEVIETAINYNNIIDAYNETNKMFSNAIMDIIINDSVMDIHIHKPVETALYWGIKYNTKEGNTYSQKFYLIIEGDEE